MVEYGGLIKVKSLFIYALLAVMCGAADANTALPKDVRSFIAKRDTCEHFRGEFPDPPDPERTQEINDNLEKYCTGTDAWLVKLKHRYAKRCDVMRKLKDYEENIEAP